MKKYLELSLMMIAGLLVSCTREGNYGMGPGMMGGYGGYGMGPGMMGGWVDVPTKLPAPKNAEWVQKLEGDFDA